MAKAREEELNFFYHYMVQRWHTNHITQMVNDHWKQIMDHEGMEHEIIIFYENIPSEPYPNKSTTIRKITQHIPSLV